MPDMLDAKAWDEPTTLTLRIEPGLKEALRTAAPEQGSLFDDGRNPAKGGE